MTSAPRSGTRPRSLQDDLLDDLRRGPDHASAAPVTAASVASPPEAAPRVPALAPTPAPRSGTEHHATVLVLRRLDAPAGRGRAHHQPRTGVPVSRAPSPLIRGVMCSPGSAGRNQSDKSFRWVFYGRTR
jgi:hypothetical protein